MEDFNILFIIGSVAVAAIAFQLEILLRAIAVIPVGGTVGCVTGVKVLVVDGTIRVIVGTITSVEEGTIIVEMCVVVMSLLNGLILHRDASNISVEISDTNV